MPKFDVLLCPIVSVKVKGVEAETYEEAEIKAEEIVNLDKLFAAVDQHTPEDIEYTGDMPYALVDVQGDEEYKLSRWVQLDRRFLVVNAFDMFTKLVHWASNVCEHFGAPPLIVQECKDALEEAFKDIRMQKLAPGQQDPHDPSGEVHIYGEQPAEEDL